jgi:hypothetical protein
MRARHRLSKLLLCYGIVYCDGKAWTVAHDHWLRHDALDQLTTAGGHSIRATFDNDYDALLTTLARRDRLDVLIEQMAADSEFTPVVRRLAGCPWGSAVPAIAGCCLACLHPGGRPGRHRIEDGGEGLPIGRQAVAGAPGRGGAGPRHHPLALQVAQSLGEQPVGQPGDRPRTSLKRCFARQRRATTCEVGDLGRLPSYGGIETPWSGSPRRAPALVDNHVPTATSSTIGASRGRACSTRTTVRSTRLASAVCISWPATHDRRRD